MIAVIYNCSFIWWSLNQISLIVPIFLQSLFFLLTWCFSFSFFSHRFFFCGHMIRIYLNIVSHFSVSCMMTCACKFFAEIVKFSTRKLTIQNYVSQGHILDTFNLYTRERGIRPIDIIENVCNFFFAIKTIKEFDTKKKKTKFQSLFRNFIYYRLNSIDFLYGQVYQY